VAASAALEVSAIGLGTLVAVLATTAAADITGVLLASLVAALGLFVIPARRKIAKTEMRNKVEQLKKQLVDTLRSQFEHEIERSLQNINTTTGPYTRFIRSERAKLEEIQERLDSIRTTLASLKSSIDEM
jgi:signal transduction histidine kinase